MNDILDQIKKTAELVSADANRNREKFPGIAEFKESLEKEFGRVKVTYVTNGVDTIGRKGDDVGWTDVDKFLRYVDWVDVLRKRRSKTR